MILDSLQWRVHTVIYVSIMGPLGLVFVCFTLITSKYVDTLWYHRYSFTRDSLISFYKSILNGNVFTIRNLLFVAWYIYDGGVTLCDRCPLHWRLKSPASRLFTQRFIQTQIKENIKAPRHWPLCGEFTETGEFPAQRTSYAENGSIWWRHHACERNEPSITGWDNGLPLVRRKSKNTVNFAYKESKKGWWDCQFSAQLAIISLYLACPEISQYFISNKKTPSVLLLLERCRCLHILHLITML